MWWVHDNVMHYLISQCENSLFESVQLLVDHSLEELKSLLLKHDFMSNLDLKRRSVCFHSSELNLLEVPLRRGRK